VFVPTLPPFLPLRGTLTQKGGPRQQCLSLHPRFVCDTVHTAFVTCSVAHLSVSPGCIRTLEHSHTCLSTNADSPGALKHTPTCALNYVHPIDHSNTTSRSHQCARVLEQARISARDSRTPPEGAAHLAALREACARLEAAERAHGPPVMRAASTQVRACVSGCVCTGGYGCGWGGGGIGVCWVSVCMCVCVG